MNRYILRIVVVSLAFFLGCKEKSGKSLGFDIIRDQVESRLMLEEYGLHDKEKCYLGPYLDSLNNWGKVYTETNGDFGYTFVRLHHIDLFVTGIEYDNSLFLFTSHFMESLYEYRDSMYLKEPLSELLNISQIKDMEEFLRLRKALSMDKTLTFSDEELLNICFSRYNEEKKIYHAFSNVITSNEEFDNWKSEHIIDWQGQEYEYNEENVHLVIQYFGLFIFKPNTQEFFLIPNALPNDFVYINTFDAGDFYLEDCHN